MSVTQNIEAFLPLLVSPDDGSELVLNQGHLQKADQSLAFPNINGIPWLFERPASSLAQWQARSQMTVNGNQDLIQDLKNQTSRKGVSKKTVERLKAIIKGTEHNNSVLTNLLGSLFVYQLGQLDTIDALLGRPSFTQNLRSYQNIIYRDWAFRDEEYKANRQALDFVAGTIPGEVEFGKTLVMGPGACRLPMDLARQFRPELTLACDINPMLLLMAQAMLQGQTIPYYEFPGAPRDFASFAVKRQLKMEAPPPENFYFVLGDALRQPFKENSMDVVVTPWFIDIIYQDFSDFIVNLNRVIKEGGYWINFGPLLFDHRDYSGRYSFEEIKIMAEKNGFVFESHKVESFSYMASPASAYQRADLLHCMVVKKVKNTGKLLTNPRYLPEWITEPSQPVPMSQEIAKSCASHGIYGGILSLVDGKRSIQEIAQYLMTNHGLPQDQAVNTLLGYFTELYEKELKGKFVGAS